MTEAGRSRDLSLTSPPPTLPFPLCGCCLQVTYKIPDVTGKDKPTYAGKHTLVVGAGHSAITTVMHLLNLKVMEPETRITWITRKEKPFVGATPASKAAIPVPLPYTHLILSIDGGSRRSSKAFPLLLWEQSSGRLLTDVPVVVVVGCAVQ